MLYPPCTGEGYFKKLQPEPSVVRAAVMHGDAYYAHQCCHAEQHVKHAAHVLHSVFDHLGRKLMEFTDLEVLLRDPGTVSLKG